MHTYMCRNAHLHVHPHRQIYIHTHNHSHVSEHKNVYTHMCTDAKTCISTCTHTHTHTHTHIHTYTHTHTKSLKSMYTITTNVSLLKATMQPKGPETHLEIYRVETYSTTGKTRQLQTPREETTHLERPVAELVTMPIWNDSHLVERLTGAWRVGE